MVVVALGVVRSWVIMSSGSEFDQREEVERDGRAKEFGDDSVTRAVGLDRVLVILPLDLFMSLIRVITLSSGRNSSMRGSASGRSMSWTEPKVLLDNRAPDVNWDAPVF